MRRATGVSAERGVARGAAGDGRRGAAFRADVRLPAAACAERARAVLADVTALTDVPELPDLPDLADLADRAALAAFVAFVAFVAFAAFAALTDRAALGALRPAVFRAGAARFVRRAPAGRRDAAAFFFAPPRLPAARVRLAAARPVEARAAFRLAIVVIPFA